MLCSVVKQVPNQVARCCSVVKRKKPSVGVWGFTWNDVENDRRRGRTENESIQEGIVSYSNHPPSPIVVLHSMSHEVCGDEWCAYTWYLNLPLATWLLSFSSRESQTMRDSWCRTTKRAQLRVGLKSIIAISALSWEPRYSTRTRTGCCLTVGVAIHGSHWIALDPIPSTLARQSLSNDKPLKDAEGSIQSNLFLGIWKREKGFQSQCQGS